MLHTKARPYTLRDKTIENPSMNYYTAANFVTEVYLTYVKPVIEVVQNVLSYLFGQTLGLYVFWILMGTIVVLLAVEFIMRTLIFSAVTAGFIYLN